MSERISENVAAVAEPPVREATVDTSVGHLSVHFDYIHPQEVPFLFGVTRQRSAGAAWASVGWHALVILAVVLIIKYAPAVGYQTIAEVKSRPNEHIVWLAIPGPGGGGGGGGNQMKELPKIVQLPGKDKISVPVMKKPDVMAMQKPQPPKPETAPPPAQVEIPAKAMGSSNLQIAGIVEGPAGTSDISHGPGTGGGFGTDPNASGTGSGPGRGSGLGPGFGGGTGGGAYQPGSGVSEPTVIRQVKPLYTPDAMRAKIQGVVVLECVVNPDGTCSNILVSHSLDPVFGLDQEAIKAARQWRFAPGIMKSTGQPVPVYVSIEMTFTLR